MTSTHPNPTAFRVTQKGVPGSVPAAKDGSGKPVPALFRPLKVRDVEFANRIFVSPMCMYSSAEGFATDFHLAHLGQFALRGVGMTMVEATAVASEGRISHQDLGIWSDDHVAGLKRIVDLAHSVNGKIGIQLAHAGRKASTYPLFEKDGRSLVPAAEGGWAEQVIAPSAVAWADYMATPVEMTTADIQRVIKDFAAAARRAELAGFDVAEIHGAHGYLIHQFLSPLTNQRTDAYGGSLENRMRFLVEIVNAVRAEWPATKPVFLRLSCTDWVESSSWDIQEVIEVVKTVAALGVDVVDCSTGGNHKDQKIAYGPNYQVAFATQIKEAVPAVRVIGVGGIKEAKQANEIVESGQADAVMLAREFLRDSFVARAALELDADVHYLDQYMYGKFR
ncbi:hypothetical protein H9P43_005767 [Blastocladiella emersonii ATCC 22665]|nr:hypothetical protein H9P43_005767 [Blastocladiella emersonii ATCC 22665]